MTREGPRLSDWVWVLKKKYKDTVAVTEIWNQLIAFPGSREEAEERVDKYFNNDEWRDEWSLNPVKLLDMADEEIRTLRVVCETLLRIEKDAKKK